MTSGARRQLAILLVLAMVAGAASAKASVAGRIGVGMLVLATFATVVFANRKLALTLTVVWLVMLGFTRRILIPFAGWSSHDPLLLFAPAAAVLLWLAVTRGPEAEIPPPRRGLLYPATFLLLWCVAQIFNPHESNLTASIEGGLLYYAAPLVWFFVARRLREDEHDRVLDTVVGITPIVLFYGLWQSFIGFFPIDLHWVGVAGFGPAIFLPGFKLRPWSVFVSPQEYGVFLAITGVVALSRAMTGRRHRELYLALFALDGLALFLQASRGTLLTYLLGLLVMVLLRMRSAAATLVSLVFVGLFALVIAGNAVTTTKTTLGNQTTTNNLPSSQALNPSTAAFEQGAPTNSQSNSSASSLVQHELSFFENPANSSLGIHEQEVFGAFGRSLANPIGYGSAVGTLAGTKSGDTVPGAESDVANVAQAFGLPGLVAYLALMIGGIFGAGFLYRRTRSAQHLAWLGILIVTLDQWWQGSLYCTSALVFLVLGGVASGVARARDGDLYARPKLLADRTSAVGS